MAHPHTLLPACTASFLFRNKRPPTKLLPQQLLVLMTMMVLILPLPLVLRTPKPLLLPLLLLLPPLRRPLSRSQRPPANGRQHTTTSSWPFACITVVTNPIRRSHLRTIRSSLRRPISCHHRPRQHRLPPPPPTSLELEELRPAPVLLRRRLFRPR